MAKSGTVSHRDGNLLPFPARSSNIRHLKFKRANAKPLILMLQGPVGPFFNVLRRTLARDDFSVLKVNFNGGDWLFSYGRGTLNFCGSTEAWGDWLRAFIQRSRPAAIVLFGDSRPYHRTAIDVARRLSVPVCCLEEGYARPHFISCEWGGNNALSPLCRGSAPDAGRDVPTPPVELVKGDLFRAMAFDAVTYHVAKTLGSWFFMGNAHHRSRRLALEAVLWARNFYRKVRYYPANNSFMMNLIENLEEQYFVVALQVHDDQQLLRHGNGWTMERLIAETIQSFARCASAKQHLVFKIHPMDRGHRSYRPFARELARLSGCTDRIHVVDDGSIGLMIRHSLGLITVNSTSGLLALNHGKPLLVLGKALYGTSRLATPSGEYPSEDIDRFWTAARSPRREYVQQFTERMYRESLLNGSFYLRPYIQATCGRVAQRLHEALGSPAAIPVPLPDEALLRPMAAEQRGGNG